MPPFRKPTLVTLRRQSPGQAWGFRLGGGADIGQPFQIQKVTAESLAFIGGLSEGDELVRIGNISLRGLTHDEVQQIIMRCSLCIDLFIFRDNGGEITPRFQLLNPPEVFKPEVFPRYQSAPVSPTINHTPIFNSHPSDLPGYDPQTTILSPSVEMRQDFNRSPRPFDPSANPALSNSTNFPSQPSQQLAMPIVQIKPGSPVSDPRVFGMSGRGGSKSPFRPPSVSRENSISPLTPLASTQAPQVQAVPQPFSQSTPTTPAATRNMAFFDSNDFNNNPVNGDKQVFGLPNRGATKGIAPLGNHGVQPVSNERKYFGVNLKQRHNSFSYERHWKESLPIVNIPNTDQLLPSQTRQMQTYINQVPPTEKNLRPSLIGLERRRIRPVWPPPHPGRTHRSGICIEGRDSPNTKMFNWPPRAQSVDRDFSYGDGPARFATPPPFQRGQTPERCESPFYNGRVCGATKIWPPPSNATPAGASGFKGEEDENYAYNPSGEAYPTLVSSHIPRTYRPPPGTQLTAPQHIVINDF